MDRSFDRMAIALTEKAHRRNDNETETGRHIASISNCIVNCPLCPIGSLFSVDFCAQRVSVCVSVHFFIGNEKSKQ